MLVEWNEILDGLETAVPMSVGLLPRTETDLYDGMWTLVWQSEEQAKAGWEEWIAGPQHLGLLKTSSICLVELLIMVKKPTMVSM